MDKIRVTRSSMPTLEEYTQEISDIWESHWMTNMGIKHQKLEELLKDRLDVPEISLFSNGHMALELLIQAMNLTGEVITTPYTFASTTHAIVRNGLEPVFCDIDPETFTMDPSKIEALITDRTSAILPVHVYGNVCNVEEIERIAKKYGLKVIYDAAHAFGEKYKGVSVANFGDASMFSFHATKVFNTIEGGAVTHNNPELEWDLGRLKNFGIKDEETVDFVGANAKMNEFAAAMGILNLRHLDEEIAKRKSVYEKYREVLVDIEGLRVFETQKEVTANYAYFPIIVDEKLYGHSRNELKEYLEKFGIFTRKYFYPITSSFDSFHGKYDTNETPVALHYSRRVLTLPMFADLGMEDVEKIGEHIREFQK